MTALSEISQLGINAAVSFLIWIYLAGKVQDRFNLGNAVMVFGVILGAGSAFMSFVNFYRRVNKFNDKNDGQAR